MTFKELQKIVENELGASKLSDIALELNVTPQVVSNWKSRNQVPYKYVLLLRKKIKRTKTESNQDSFNLSQNEAKRIIDLNDIHYDKNDDDQTFTEFIASIYKFLIPNWKYFLVVPIFFFILSIVYLNYFARPVYTATAKLLPISAEKSGGSIRGLASQFGIGLGEKASAGGLSSSNMVPDIIKSRLLAKELLKVELKTEKYKEALPLINIISGNPDKSIKWPDAAINAYATVLLLNIEIEQSKESALIQLFVNASEPGLAKDIASAIIDLLNKTMSRFKISQVKEKKYFIENRLNEINVDLKASEEKLKDFRIKNRSISSSPSLILEQSRLLREVEAHTQVFITLKQEFEMVKISEIDISTIVQVLDPPEKPLYKTSPKSSKVKLVSILFGIFLSFAYIILSGWYNQNYKLFRQK